MNKTFANKNGFWRLCAAACLAAAACIPADAGHQLTDPSMTPRQRAALRELFNAFPEAEDLSAVRARIDEDIRLRALSALRDNDSLPEFGAADGATVVEFSDYQCGYCKRMFPLLRAENARVKVVEFPVLGEMSTRAARYALAARKQGGYDNFHIALMELGGRLTEEGIRSAADSAGLDWERLQKDGEGGDIDAALRENRRLAGLLGVRGTPFFVIGDRTVPGAMSAERLHRLLSEVQQ